MWYAVYGFWLLLGVTLLAAHRWGGPSERAVATIYFVAALATLIVRFPGTSHYAGLDLGVFAIDLLLLLGLLWILAKNARWWLIGSAALQLVAVLGHVAMFDAPRTRPFAYFATVVSSSYPALLVLIYATLRGQNIRQREGATPYAQSPTLSAPS